MKAGPSRGGAVRPEKRVTAKSKLPQKKCTGLHFPMNWHRTSFNTRSLWARMRQTRFAYFRSYEWWTLSSSKRIGEGISTGIGQIFTAKPMSPSKSMTSR